MTELPIVHMTLYKHGVGYYRRRGPVDGEAVKLTFRRDEMDDLLKSLTVINYSGGRVHGVDYETPQSQAERLAGSSVILDDSRSLRDLLQALRGRRVRLSAGESRTEEGLLLGLDEEEEESLTLSLVSLLRIDSNTVVTLPLYDLAGVEILDDTAATDLRFFLKTALGQEMNRSITIRLAPGRHDLEVSYIAPAPTWRVSYRLVADGSQAGEEKPELLLQGWGIFDNRLEEDLNNISLSLTAGMPISFIYDLYTPHTPERPVVRDEDRVAAGPILFEGAVADELPAAPAPMMAKAMLAEEGAAVQPYGSRRRAAAEAMAASVQSAASGRAMGELFQYNVDVPVTVGRGQSAMVPIVSTRLPFKKELIYNGQKMPVHPVATLRFNNETGLTLERGPVTVLEAEEYVGEAVLPFTADKAEAVISYAVELGIHVKEEVNHEHKLQALQVKDGYLLQQFYNIRRTVYRVDNRTPQPKTVLIEHASPGGYSVFDTPEPVEKTLDSHRYKVEAKPGTITAFTVQERRMQSSHEELRKLSYQGLKQYFEGRFLDKETYQGLKALLDTWAEIEGLEKTIAGQEQSRAKIYTAQEQAQKNMTVLGKEGDEGKLRARYVQQIGRSEEELAEIERTITRLRSEIAEKQAAIQKMIAGLAS